MEHKTDYIFAVINLGSSHVSGMLASKLSDGRIINPIAQTQRPSMGSVQHGRVHNITELSQIVSSIVDQLSQELDEGMSIEGVYVGLDCQSMRSHTFKAQLSFGPEGVVLDGSHLRELSRQAAEKNYRGHSVLHITEPRYYVDGKREYKPNGVRCHHIEANYQLITVRREIEANVQEVFEGRLGLKLKGILITPIAEASISLTREEMMLGCAYINMGGGTTSISLYQQRILSALYVLPLGGINVSRDLTKLRLLESDAEQVKLRHGSMDLDVDKSVTLTANHINGQGEKTLSHYSVNSYIYARMEEITSNVLMLIKEIDPEMQLSSLVFAGGATRLKGYMEDYIGKLPIGEMARQATARPDILHESASKTLLGEYQSVLGLVAMASENCVVQAVKPLDTLFDDTPEEDETPTEAPTPIVEPEDVGEKDYNDWRTSSEDREDRDSEEPEDEDVEDEDEAEASEENESEEEEEPSRPKVTKAFREFGHALAKTLENWFGVGN